MRQISMTLRIMESESSQGVVNICSPVKTALAPAMKHIACSDSESVFRPAAKRMIVVGSTIRAVAIVLTKVWCETGWLDVNTRLLEGIEVHLIAFQRRSWYGHEGIHGEGLRMLWHTSTAD